VWDVLTWLTMNLTIIYIKVELTGYDNGGFWEGWSFYFEA